MNYSEIRSYLKSEKSYSDKIQAAKNYVDTDILKLWAVDCSESVLHIYESKYPNDTRIRDCIQATKDYLAGKIGLDELESRRNAAYAARAANNAAYSAAYSAADAAYAAHSAASAADAANSAAYSAAYSAADSAAYAAYSAAYSAADSAARAAKKKQQELNIQLLINRLVKKVPNTNIARKMYPKANIKDDMLIIEL